jgi:hypothetical protein
VRAGRESAGASLLGVRWAQRSPRPRLLRPGSPGAGWRRSDSRSVRIHRRQPSVAAPLAARLQVGIPIRVLGQRAPLQRREGLSDRRRPPPVAGFAAAAARPHEDDRGRSGDPDGPEQRLLSSPEALPATLPLPPKPRPTASLPAVAEAATAGDRDGPPAMAAFLLLISEVGHLRSAVDAASAAAAAAAAAAAIARGSGGAGRRGGQAARRPWAWDGRRAGPRLHVPAKAAPTVSRASETGGVQVGGGTAGGHSRHSTVASTDPPRLSARTMPGRLSRGQWKSYGGSGGSGCSHRTVLARQRYPSLRHGSARWREMRSTH